MIRPIRQRDPILGPVPCQGCGVPVVWTGHRWRGVGQLGKGSHRCETATKCGAFMPNVRERCARRKGHGYEHRTAYALANAARAQRAGWTA